MLVWRMNGIAVEPKSHQYRFAFEFFFEQRDNGNASAGTHRNRRNAKGFGIRFVSGLVTNAVNGRDITLTAVVWFDFYGDAAWCNAFEMFCEQFGDFFPILVWNQTH